MAKRFIDTELWQKEWFQELSLKHKILLKYIFENCDCAGVWDVNFRLASFVIGENVTMEDVEEINSTKKQFEILENKNIFVIDFIKFQYGTLSENCKPHKPVIEKLKKYNLYERVLEGYQKVSENLEEKEQYQYKEKEKEKDISSLVLSSLSEGQKLYGDEYQNVCLDLKQYNKLLGICASKELLNELINSFSRNIEVGKERPYIAELPNAHYERLKSYYHQWKMNPRKEKKEIDGWSL